LLKKQLYLEVFINSSNKKLLKNNIQFL